MIQRFIDTLCFDFTQDLCDTQGRPLGESASVHYSNVDTKEVQCPYRDGRQHQIMNQTALEQVAIHWEDICANSGFLLGEQPSIYQAWKLCYLASIAPNIYHSLYPHRSIPVFLSAYYKTVLGFSQVLSFLMMAHDGIAERSLRELGDEKTFLQWLDAQNWLHGQKQVCSGSPQMIGRFFSVLCGESTKKKLHPIWKDLSRYERALEASVEFAGLQAAFLIASMNKDESTLLATEKAMIDSPPQSFLFPITLSPNREPHHARRLFPSHKVPQCIDDFLRGISYEVLKDKIVASLLI